MQNEDTITELSNLESQRNSVKAKEHHLPVFESFLKEIEEKKSQR